MSLFYDEELVFNIFNQQGSSNRLPPVTGYTDWGDFMPDLSQELHHGGTQETENSTASVIIESEAIASFEHNMKFWEQTIVPLLRLKEEQTENRSLMKKARITEDKELLKEIATDSKWIKVIARDEEGKVIGFALGTANLSFPHSEFSRDFFDTKFSNNHPDGKPVFMVGESAGIFIDPFFLEDQERVNATVGSLLQNTAQQAMVGEPKKKYPVIISQYSRRWTENGQPEVNAPIETAIEYYRHQKALSQIPRPIVTKLEKLAKKEKVNSLWSSTLGAMIQEGRFVGHGGSYERPLMREILRHESPTGPQYEGDALQEMGVLDNQQIMQYKIQPSALGMRMIRSTLMEAPTPEEKTFFSNETPHRLIGWMRGIWNGEGRHCITHDGEYTTEQMESIIRLYQESLSEAGGSSFGKTKKYRVNEASPHKVELDLNSILETAITNSEARKFTMWHDQSLTEPMAIAYYLPANSDQVGWIGDSVLETADFMVKIVAVHPKYRSKAFLPLMVASLTELEAENTTKDTVSVLSDYNGLLNGRAFDVREPIQQMIKFLARRAARNIPVAKRFLPFVENNLPNIPIGFESTIVGTEHYTAIPFQQVMQST